MIIICGGTGGHFYPGLTVARRFKEHGGIPKLFLAGRNAEKHAKCASGYGIESLILPLPITPDTMKNILTFVIQTVKGIFISRKELKKFKADCVLAMGSFLCVAPALAALSMKIPIFLHDGNARIGRANLLLSRWAKHLGLSFPPVNVKKCKCPFTVTGMPVRPELVNCKLSKDQAISAINRDYGVNLNETLPLLFIFGGSLSASTLNRVLPEALVLQEDDDFQVIHIAGTGNKEFVQKQYDKAQFPLLVLESTDDMKNFYSAANMIVCRAGGSTIAELSIFAKFAILIPFPHAKENHQADNAAYYISSGAGIHISEKECTVAKMASTLAAWREKPDYYTEKGGLAGKLAKPDAANNLLNLIQR